MVYLRKIAIFFTVMSLLSFLSCFTDNSDVDNDGIQDNNDNCIEVYNPDQADSDGDGLGDKCESITWAKTLTGLGFEEANDVQQTTDGGYIVAGYTVLEQWGASDVYLIKLDAYGEIEWSTTYGGEGAQKAFSIQQTTDEGFIVCGYSFIFGTGSRDLYISKLDKSGYIQWEKTWENDEDDVLNSVLQTKDGGYFATGTISITKENKDIFLVKLDASGNTEWEKILGGTKYDSAVSAQQTKDSGYIVAGYMSSNARGYYLLKLDSSGNEEWSGVYGTTTRYAYVVKQTMDGGYIVSGYIPFSNSTCVVKVNASGDEEWSRTYEEDGSPNIYSGDITNDGGFIAAGYYLPPNHDLGYTVPPNTGSIDFYILKVDSSGEKVWSKVFGRRDSEYASSIKQTSDGGFVVTGCSIPYSIPGRINDLDIWIIKMDENGFIYDIDGDLVFYAEDNCQYVFNPDQEDSNGCNDGQGSGDACEWDFDGDTVPDECDNCPTIPNLDQEDLDGDGYGDACGPDCFDIDGDGLCSDIDICPDMYNPGNEPICFG